MKTGIYSGSFDPIHIGHTTLAQWLACHTDLDRVWLMVSPVNPLKTGYSGSDHDRLNMARIACQSLKNVTVSDFEFTLPRPSYTYSTLTELSHKYPDDEFRLIIGSDNWEIFNRWFNADKIISEFGILIYPRPGYAQKMPETPKNVEFLADAPQTDISSTTIREMIRQGADVSRLLPPGVLPYIRQQSLYKR